MKIPGAELAIVDPEKVRDYLLSPTHPVGKFKSVFFAALGYTEEKLGGIAARVREDRRDRCGGTRAVQPVREQVRDFC
ncbi:MAG: DUF6883 domain-containing protein [Polyangiales bacterium]